MACLVRLANALAFCGAILALRGEAAPRRAGAQRLERDTDTAGMLVITDLLVTSTIVSRYALTTMRSAVHNPGSESREAVFDVDLPGTAFISNFTLTVNDKVYTAEVKEKEKAQRVYDAARRRGQTAAHVATRGRETERFRVAVNVEARGRVDFALTYEELLQRRLGRYELAVSLGPGQVVRNLTVEVAISERAGIEYVRVLPIRTSKLLNNKLKGSQDGPESTTVERTPTCARVRFAPTPEQQAQYSSQGILGDFVVQYDVRPTDLIGDVQTYNGYFVHYFAPRNLPVVTKNVIFVIDVSSSMIGTKIRQTKEAMNTILSDLRPEDAFNIITFSDAIQVWKPDESILATKQNVQSARKYVSNMVAEGWTDINAALLAAAKFFRREAPSKPGDGAGGEASKVPLVIFLTDGEPTSGVTSTGAIINNVREAMRGSLSLFCLGFGDDVDFPLLQRLALDNRGVARRIYEDADANLQLKGFYDEVASPLLFDIQLDYLDNRVESVTRTLFPTFFNGSELVVAGRLSAGPGGPLRVRLQAMGSSEAVELENEILLNRTEPTLGCPHVAGGAQDFVQRLWAYHTIKELLQARLKMDEEDGRKLLTEKATTLSLKYNFVTPLTSMVVVKPGEDGATTPAAATTTAHPTASSAGSSARPHSTPGAAGSDVLSPSTKSPLAPSERPQARKPHVQGTSSSAGMPGRSTAGPKGGKGSAAPPVQTAPGTTLETAATVPETPVPFARGIAATDVPEGVAYATMLRSGDVYVQTKLDSDHFETETDGDYYDEIHDADLETESDGDYYYGFHDADMEAEMDGNDYYEIHDADLVITGHGLLRSDVAMPYFYSVDGDPHFVVKLPHSNDTVCFTIDGRADDTLRLVEDPHSGVTVDGHLMGAPVNPRHKHRPRNFFDLISVRVARPAEAPAGWGLGGYRVNVSRQGVTLEGEHQLTVPWDSSSSSSVISKPGLRLTVSRSAGVTLWIGAKIQFLVLLHRYADPSPLQLDHLGFYVVRGDGLSHHAQGLLGQFQHADMDLRKPKFGRGARDPVLAELRRRGQKVAVSLRTKMLKDSPLPEHAAPCWLVRREDVAPLIGAYADYVVPRPRSSRARGL